MKIYFAKNKDVIDGEYGINVRGDLKCFIDKEPYRSKYEGTISHVIKCKPYINDDGEKVDWKIDKEKQYIYDDWIGDNEVICDSFPYEIQGLTMDLSWDNDPISFDFDELPETLHFNGYTENKKDFFKI